MSRIFQKNLSMQEKWRILHRLAQLHQHDYSILEALQIVRQAANPRQVVIIDKMIHQLDGGSSLAVAVKEANFSPYVQQVVGQADEHGKLTEALLKASKWKERRMKIRKEWQKVLTYPIVLVLLLCLMSYLIFILVIPQFQVMFASFHVELPYSTQATLRFFQFISANYIIIMLVLFSLGITLWFVLRHPNARRSLIRVLLWLPATKQSMQWYYSSSFAHQLGNYLQANIPLYDSIVYLSSRSRSLMLKEEIQKIEAKLLRGDDISEAIQGSPLFLPDMYLLLYYAERNGNLGRELYQYGVELEDQAIQTFMDRLKWIEPMLLVGIGVIIAFLFISLFSPILQLIEVL